MMPNLDLHPIMLQEHQHGVLAMSGSLWMHQMAVT
uniref:Uncharacterized protein n=1 Tax=Arundo donax TaxID=35708 RepID=A0A0A9HTN6_ARUDO